MKAGPRRHGLQWPLHPLQVGTWSILALLALDFYLVQFPLMPDAWAGPTALTYGALMLGLLVAGGITSTTDSRDRSVNDNREETKKEVTEAGANPVGGPSEEERVMCYICQVKVHTTSAHCRFCNKCVEGFDHHCKWLNNCVGKRNHGAFMSTVGMALATTGLQLGVIIALLVQYFTDSQTFGIDVLSHLPLLSVHLCVALLLASGLIVAVVLVLVAQLGIFHIMLMVEGITTYEYVVREQRKQREREEAKAKPNKQARRVVAPQQEEEEEEDGWSNGCRLEMGCSPAQVVPLALPER